jgi:hypothetical protein
MTICYALSFVSQASQTSILHYIPRAGTRPDIHSFLISHHLATVSTKSVSLQITHQSFIANHYHTSSPLNLLNQQHNVCLPELRPPCHERGSIPSHGRSRIPAALATHPATVYTNLRAALPLQVTLARHQLHQGRLSLRVSLSERLPRQLAAHDHGRFRLLPADGFRQPQHGRRMGSRTRVPQALKHQLVVRKRPQPAHGRHKSQPGRRKPPHGRCRHPGTQEERKWRQW